jgi:hypothetical protein
MKKTVEEQQNMIDQTIDPNTTSTMAGVANDDRNDKK